MDGRLIHLNVGIFVSLVLIQAMTGARMVMRYENLDSK